MAASTSKKKPASRKAAPAKAAAGRSPATKNVPAKKPTAVRKPATKAAAKKATAARPAKKTAAPAPAKRPAKATSKATAKHTPAAATKPPTKPPAKQSAPKQSAAKPAAPHPPAPKQPAKRSAMHTPAKLPAAKQPAPKSSSSKATTPETVSTDSQLPKPKFNKEGLGYTKDFDLPFVKAQHDMLQKEREHLTGQALRLEDEAHQLVEEAEMGDVQFDDEGGEGDTMVVERERDLALSAQARDAVAEIDAALVRIMAGTYGYSVLSGRPIPKERLEAIPWSSVLVEEKVGGIGRR
jgi:RNA polymerase-binding transcription factor DksA